MHRYDIVTSIDGEIVVSVMPNLLLIIYTVYCVLFQISTSSKSYLSLSQNFQTKNCWFDRQIGKVKQKCEIRLPLPYVQQLLTNFEIWYEM